MTAETAVQVHEELDHVQQTGRRLEHAMAEVMSGKPEVLRLTVTVLFAGGHLLIEDVPGVGKTVLAKSLARAIDCDFSRVQFTPDLLPSEITGVAVFNQGSGQARSSPTSSLAMRSTAPPPRRSRLCSRAWKRARSPLTGRRTSCPSPSS